MNDWERVVKWFRDHPGSSVQEVRFGLFISNVTGRMSDAREHGVEFRKWRDAKGIYRYSLVEAPVQQVMMHATPGFPGFEHVAGTEPDRCFACRNPDESQPPKFSLQMQRQWP